MKRRRTDRYSVTPLGRSDANGLGLRADPEFQKKLDSTDEIVRREAEPLDLASPDTAGRARARHGAHVRGLPSPLDRPGTFPRRQPPALRDHRVQAPLNIRQVKARLNQIVGALPDEGSVVITRNGRPCAVLMPVTDDTDLEVLALSERKGWTRLEDLEP